MSHEAAGNRWAVEVEGLSRSFGDRVALDSVSLRIPQGSILGLLGLNGAGKSTLLRILIGHLRPDKGKIRLLERTALGDNPSLRAEIGYVSDKQYLYDWMTVA